MNLGEYAIQLLIARIRAEELKDDKWLAEIKEAQKLGAGVYIKKPYLIEKFGRAVKRELEA